MWCRVGGVGARSRRRGGLGYRLVRKHARTETQKRGRVFSKMWEMEF